MLRCQIDRHRHSTTRFCIGDRYYLHDGKILCEMDFAELINSGNHKLINENTLSNCNQNDVKRQRLAKS